MKFFLLTLIFIFGLGGFPKAKGTDEICNPAVAELGTTCVNGVVDLVKGFRRLQIADQADQRHFSNPVVETAATYIVGAVDTMALPLEFVTYALAVGLLSVDYGSVAKAIKIVNSEEEE